MRSSPAMILMGAAVVITGATTTAHGAEEPSDHEAVQQDEREHRDRRERPRYFPEESYDRDREEPREIDAFDPSTIGLQAAGGTAGIGAVGLLGLGLVGLAVASPSSGVATGLGFTGGALLVMAPPLGAGAGVYWVGRSRHGSVDGAGSATQLGAWGGLAAAATFISGTGEEDVESFPARFVAEYYAFGGAATLVGAILGYHLNVLLSGNRGGHRADTQLNIGPYQGLEGTGNAGISLTWNGRF